MKAFVLVAGSSGETGLPLVQLLFDYGVALRKKQLEYLLRKQASDKIIVVFK